MVTQHDIARSLGISQTTVSFALRGHPMIPKATARSVQAAARRLGYRPDPLISALMAQRRRGRTASIRAKLAFVTAFPARDEWRASHYAAGCFEGARRAAASRGYLCEATWLWEPGLKPERLSQILWTQNVQGLILAPLPVNIPPITLAWERFAAVSLDYSLAEPELHRVVDDHAFGLERVMTEIAALGYRRPGLVLRDSQDVRTHHRRLGAFLVGRELRSGWGNVPPLVLPNDRWNAELFAAWLRRERPDVVLTEEAELPAATRKLGLRVPRDIGVVFFHKDHPERELSGLQTDSQRVGAIAAGVVMRLIETNERGAPAVPTTTLVKSFTWQRGRTLRRQR